MRYFIKGKWLQMLELFGLRIPADWLMLRVLIRELGTEEAQSLYAQSILLDMKYNGVPTKKRFEAIVEATKEATECEAS